MRPAEGAVAGVDPEFAHLGGADVGDVGGGGGAQAAPVVGIAALRGSAGVGHAGEDGFDAGEQHLAALLRQGGVQAQIVAAHFNRAGHAQGVAQAGHGDFLVVVDGGDLWCQLGPKQGQGDAIPFAGIHR